MEVMARGEEVMVARGGQRVLMSVVGGGSPLLWGNVFQLLRRDAGTKRSLVSLVALLFPQFLKCSFLYSQKFRTFHGTDG